MTSSTVPLTQQERVLSSVVEHGIADPAVTGSIPVAPSIRHGVVGNISACHADARGSIPRVGGCSISLVVRTPRCGRGNPGSNPGWGILCKLGLVGYDARLTRERSRVRSSELVSGTLAEWLRRMIRNHMGFSRVGSNPTRVVLASISLLVLFLSSLQLSRSTKRQWCNGYHVCFPSRRPGFNSRLPQVILLRQLQLKTLLLRTLNSFSTTAALAQLGERQTEDLKVPGSIPGGGNAFAWMAEWSKALDLSSSIQ